MGRARVVSISSVGFVVSKRVPRHAVTVRVGLAGLIFLATCSILGIKILPSDFVQIHLIYLACAENIGCLNTMLVLLRLLETVLFANYKQWKR